MFRYKGWEPSKYYNLPRGERAIVRAFAQVESEERNKTIDELNNIV